MDGLLSSLKHRSAQKQLIISPSRLIRDPERQSDIASTLFQRIGFILQHDSCNQRQFRLGDGEPGEAATQTHPYLGVQQNARVVPMLEPTEMNHHFSRQFGLFG
jgi:hypothetical protein